MDRGGRHPACNRNLPPGQSLNSERQIETWRFGPADECAHVTAGNPGHGGKAGLRHVVRQKEGANRLHGPVIAHSKHYRKQMFAHSNWRAQPKAGTMQT